MKKITSLLLVGILFLASCTKQDIPVPQQDVSSNQVSTTSVQTNSVGEGQFAYVFIEPKNKQNLITKFLKDSVPHSRFPFLGFNFGFGITSENKNDILNYIDLKYWYNGQLPSVRTVNVSQTTFNIDSLSINNLSINDNSTWVSILIPVSAMANDTRRQNTIKIGGTGLKTSIVTMNKSVFGHQLDYTGNRLPKGRYRIYTTFVSPTMRFNLSRTGHIFIKGNN